ncbi:hypothetical protein BGX20_006464, partial [Mortierella sp. AD010]
MRKSGSIKGFQFQRETQGARKSKNKEIYDLTKWIKDEYTDAKGERRQVVLLGDFNAVCNPKIDRRAGASSKTTPEAEILKWIETEPLRDAFRTRYPITPDFTCRGVSRIDMIFLDGLLVDRLSKVKHKTIKAIDSDHRMVTATISTQGLIQAPSNPTKYKKPKGFRFTFKETEKVQWKAFEDAMNIQLLDPEKMKTLGVKGLLEEDADQIGRLKKLDIEEAWR